MEFKYNKAVNQQRQIRLEANKQALERKKKEAEDQYDNDPPTETPTDWKSLDPNKPKQNQDLPPSDANDESTKDDQSVVSKNKKQPD